MAFLFPSPTNDLTFHTALTTLHLVSSGLYATETPNTLATDQTLHHIVHTYPENYQKITCTALALIHLGAGLSHWMLANEEPPSLSPEWLCASLLFDWGSLYLTSLFYGIEELLKHNEQRSQANSLTPLLPKTILWITGTFYAPYQLLTGLLILNLNRRASYVRTQNTSSLDFLDPDSRIAPHSTLWPKTLPLIKKILNSGDKILSMQTELFEKDRTLQQEQCSITKFSILDPLRDPTTPKHVAIYFERSALIQYLTTHPYSPITRLPLNLNDLYEPNAQKEPLEKQKQIHKALLENKRSIQELIGTESWLSQIVKATQSCFSFLKKCLGQ